MNSAVLELRNRSIAFAVIGLVASLLGAITSAGYAAPVWGIAVVLLFSALEYRVVRRIVFSPSAMGRSMPTIWFLETLGETVVVALGYFLVLSIPGVDVGNFWLALGLGVAGWYALCRESLKTYLLMASMRR